MFQSVGRVPRAHAVRSHNAWHSGGFGQIQSEVGVGHLQLGGFHVWERPQGKRHGGVGIHGQHGAFHQVVRRRSDIQRVGRTGFQLQDLGKVELRQGDAVFRANHGAFVVGLLGKHVEKVTLCGCPGIDQRLHALHLTACRFRVEFGDVQEFLLEQDVEVGRGQAQRHAVAGDFHVGRRQFQAQTCPAQVQVILEPVEQRHPRAEAHVARLDGVGGKLVGERVDGLTDVHPEAGGGVQVGQEGALGGQRGNLTLSETELRLLELKVVLEGMLQTTFQGPSVCGLAPGGEGQASKGEENGAHASKIRRVGPQMPEDAGCFLRLNTNHAKNAMMA